MPRATWVSALLVVALATHVDAATSLTPVGTRDPKIVRRWSLNGSPAGLAIGRNGIVYVGMTNAQSLLAINISTGSIQKELVLDSPHIAATKELLTLRVNHDGTLLAIANGSDESVTLVAIPSLDVRREISLEGEVVRDTIFDHSGRNLFVMGRSVHAFDREGKKEIRRLEIDDPAAMAVDASGRLLAVAGSEDFGNGKVSILALYDTTTLKEISREPLETDRRIQQLLFAADDQAIVAIADDWLGEKSLAMKAPKTMIQDQKQARIRLEFGDMMSTERICLPPKSGPQIATLGRPSSVVLFAERRCSAGSSFRASARKTTTQSVYGISAYAIAFDASAGRLFATDRAGYFTIYKVVAPPSKKRTP
ncbi:MAG TPA: hypothetical protein VNM92_09155 [Thermoanaerobaculia bacterium]|nr:hypothetical protein [Thermoanaerobaculia bacterium]